MQKKFSPIWLAMLLACVSFVPAAGAAQRPMLNVAWSYDIASMCRVAPDQLQLTFVYTVTLQRRHTPRPKNVIVRWAVKDGATGSGLGEGRVMLTSANKWRMVTNPVIAEAGQALAYESSLSYRNPLNGKLLSASGDDPDKVPSVEDMDATDQANPSAPPFAACK